MAADPVLIFFSLLFGLIIGSFLNVCIYRIPLKKSIITPSSGCPKCGNQINFYDNIPLISYMILFGKCRFCKEPIPLRYPIIELITGLLSLSIFIRYGFSFQYILYFIFSSSLVVITFIDIDHQIIPDPISLPGILLGFLFSLSGLNAIGWKDSLIGLLLGGGSLYLIAVLFKWLTGKDGMGGGDVKLLAMIGAWLGWKSLSFVVLLSSISGIIIGGGSLLFSGKGL